MQVIIIFFSKHLGIVEVDIKTTNSIAFGDMESNNTIFILKRRGDMVCNNNSN